LDLKKEIKKRKMSPTHLPTYPSLFFTIIYNTFSTQTTIYFLRPFSSFDFLVSFLSQFLEKRQYCQEELLPSDRVI